LKIWGCGGDVAAALQDIRKLLNDQLSESVKAKFHGGEAGSIIYSIKSIESRAV